MSSSACQRSDKSFGPRVDTSCRAFDFTLLFEDIFFATLPAAVFLSLLPPHITFLARNPVACSVRSKLLFSKLTALTGVLTTQVAFLVLRSRNGSFLTSASLTADALSVVGTAGAAWLSLLDHQRSLRPSTVLSLYLSVLVVLDTARVRTSWLMGYQNQEAAVLTATLASTVAALLLESVEKKTSLKPDKLSGAPEQYSGIWIRTTFAWLLATFRVGYLRVISLKDIPKLDTRLESHVLRERLVSTWAKYDHQERHSLLRAAFRSYLPSFLSAVLPRLCKTVFSFAQPFLINTTVSYVGEAQPDSSYGKGLIGAWGLVFLGISVSTAIYQYQNTRFITRLRGGLLGLIYQETLKARSVDSGDITAVALMGTDVERIGQSFMMIHESWGALLDIGIAIWLLERQVFLASLAPVVIIVVFVAATGQLASATKTSQRKWIEKVQDRLRVTSSMLDDMKAVKMLGLSGVMSTIVTGMRRTEIKTSKVFRKLVVARLLLSNTPLNLAPVATFAVYVIISVYWKDESLLTAQAFTSLALINLLTMPVLIFIQTVPTMFQSIGSFDRIQEYCNYNGNSNGKVDDLPSQESNGSIISLQSLTRETLEPGQSLQKHVSTVENQSYSWSKSKPPVLKNINLHVAKGKTTMIVGAVGSGKTTLLESILGETIPSVQKVPAYQLGTAAYCAQQPWLENGTIRSNIIGVSPYDGSLYATVKFTCGLDQDLRELEKGDQTMVGSKGLNLSGGQKQRIALARAVYSRKDFVLLDDVFSGMDAHTVDIVSRRLLGKGGIFRSRATTVVLATHSQKLMALSDSLVSLEDGEIVEVGSPKTLMGNGGYVASLGLHLSDDDTEDVLETARNDSAVAESIISAVVAAEEDEALSDKRRKNGDFTVYKYYFSSTGPFIIAALIFSMAIWIFCTEFPTVWLKWWSEANAIEPNANVGLYMGIYTFISLFGVVSICISCWIVFVPIISRSGYRLHGDLLESTLRAPFRFFTQTDTGTLTNRFSQDMELIDMQLPVIMVNYISTLFSVIAKTLIIVVFSQYLAVTAPFVIAILYFLQRFYLQTSRQVRLLEIEAKAPLFTHFSESVAGAATIRAFGWQSHYQERNYHLINQSARPAYLQYCIQDWLSFVLNIVVAALAVIIVAIVVTWKDKFSAGSVGVSLVMVMAFGSVLMRLITMWTMMESSIGAVTRVKRFVEDTEVEERDGWGREVPKNWPQAGKMDFKGLVAAHRPDAEPVIKGVSMSIKPQEHVAICGRSGSGKTSLILALLKMIDTQGGQILIEDVDVASLACTDVRSCLNVVPQDPFLLPGTIRFNMDPFGTATDEAIIHALERVRLWTIVEEQGGLDKEMDRGAWSAGQKQLLCLGRAMARDSRILILDEATSSVDTETEGIMQEIIDTEFKGCTVLAVMHRLKHVTRYDKVALLGNGILLEFDSPTTLLRQESKFADLYQSSSK
ncbi:ABC transporter [Xylariales sp. AK1849]|nr:ABC transporter [Xylariales sp. AK1849]